MRRIKKGASRGKHLPWGALWGIVAPAEISREGGHFSFPVPNVNLSRVLENHVKNKRRVLENHVKNKL